MKNRLLIFGFASVMMLAQSCKTELGELRVSPKTYI